MRSCWSTSKCVVVDKPMTEQDTLTAATIRPSWSRLTPEGTAAIGKVYIQLEL